MENIRFLENCNVLDWGAFFSKHRECKLIEMFFFIVLFRNLAYFSSLGVIFCLLVDASQQLRPLNEIYTPKCYPGLKSIQ